MAYDSTEDTCKHIERVQDLIDVIVINLFHRSNKHDRSKLLPPEKPIFDEYTPKLKDSTYGSDEYKSYLANMQEALQHHYAHNSHHPEFVEVNEQWRDIEGFEGYYEVSDRGRVRSVDRVVPRQGLTKSLTCKEQIRKPFVTPKGYERLQLTKNGSAKNFFVHILVAKAFITNPEDKPEVNHKNGIKADNRYSNLEWVTSSENQIHAYDNGLKESTVKYVVTCTELDITTFGCNKMERVLRERGYERAESAAIWRCINEGGSHLDLNFTSQNIDEYNYTHSPVNGMSLLDLIEMLADWKAATERHANGDIRKSIDINTERFKLSPQLADILRNTVRELGW